MKKKLILFIILIGVVMMPFLVNAVELPSVDSEFIEYGGSTSNDDNGSIGFILNSDVYITAKTYLCSNTKCENNSSYEHVEEASNSISILDSNNEIIGNRMVKNGESIYINFERNDNYEYNAIYLQLTNSENINEYILIGLSYTDLPSITVLKSENKNDEEDNFDTIESVQIVDQKFLDSIKAQGRQHQIGTSDGSYAWIFDGSKIDTTNFNVSLWITFDSSENLKKIESLIPAGKDNPLFLHFDHHGDLPLGTIVKIRVSDKYKNGEKLFLYYYNESTGKLEEVAKDIEVKDGYVEFGLEHCSDYVLARNDNSNNAQTSSMNITIYMIISLISFIGIISIIVIRKKKIA